MRFSTLIYTIKQGIVNIFRNKWYSLASMATISACLFMFGIFYSLVANFQYIVKEAQDGVAVTVFFEEGISDERIAEIGSLIEKRAEVSHVNFVSADAAWESFKDDYLGEYADGFGDDNPLPNSANYEVYLNDVSMQNSLVKYLRSITGVREVKESAKVANTLTDFNHLLGYVSGGIIIILLGVAVFLISNTVTVGIAVRREEIGIMKLIGATDYLVRAPFVVEGMVIGMIGAAIPLILLYFMYQKIIVYIAEKFNFIGAMINFVSVHTVFKTLVPVAIILGAGIGFLGSRMTIRKHLKV